MKKRLSHIPKHNCIDFGELFTDDKQNLLLKGKLTRSFRTPNNSPNKDIIKEDEELE
jgi:hypothetical protein